MRICLVRNPKSGSAQELAALEELLAPYTKSGECEVRETRGPGDARRIAAAARREGFDVVLAAGGDGTVTEVIDGVLEDPGRVAVGILPLGTGNDLARTLDIPLDPAAAFRVALEGRERTIDLVHVLDDEGKSTHVANVAAGGFSGAVDLALDGVDKSRFGTLSYLMGALKALPELKPYRLHLRWNDALSEELEALNVVVANGRTVAGGWRVAPDADLEDGLLDVMVIQNGTAMELAALAALFAGGTPMDSPLVIHRRARAVKITSDPPMLFNADGELLTDRPVTFTAMPKALRVIVGPDYFRTREERAIGAGGPSTAVA